MSKPLRSVWMCGLMIWAALQFAHADGGRLRFSQKAGPFLITLFTTPEPLTPGPVDFSVMVQDAATGQMFPDAAVQLRLDNTDGKIVHAKASHVAATNKLLQAAQFTIPSAGAWHLHLDIIQSSRSAYCDAEISVQPGSRTALLTWIFAILPILAIALFVLHQRQKLARYPRS